MRYANDVSYTSDKKYYEDRTPAGDGDTYQKYSANRDRDTAYSGAYAQTRTKPGNVSVHIHSSHANNYEHPAMIELNMENSNDDIDFRGYGTIQIRSRTNSPENTRYHQGNEYGGTEVRDQINRVTIGEVRPTNQSSQASGVRVGADSRSAIHHSFGQGSSKERLQGYPTHTITTSQIVTSKDYRTTGSSRKEGRQDS